MLDRLTNSEKEIPTLVNNVEYWLEEMAEKLK